MSVILRLIKELRDAFRARSLLSSSLNVPPRGRSDVFSRGGAVSTVLSRSTRRNATPGGVERPYACSHVGHSTNSPPHVPRARRRSYGMSRRLAGNAPVPPALTCPSLRPPLPFPRFYSSRNFWINLGKLPPPALPPLFLRTGREKLNRVYRYIYF